MKTGVQESEVLDNMDIMEESPHPMQETQETPRSKRGIQSSHINPTSKWLKMPDYNVERIFVQKFTDVGNIMKATDSDIDFMQKFVTGKILRAEAHRL